MPRRTALLTTARAAKPRHENRYKGPRLWNAHRRIESTTGLNPEQWDLYKKQYPHNQGWRSQVSPDVAKFVDDMRTLEENTDNPPNDHYGQPMVIRPENSIKNNEARLLPEREGQLLRHPHIYFASSQHVPRALRQKVYFPDFSVILLRSPLYPPRYASFFVPLWFNKVDMRNLLLEAYDVEILHVRSTVVVGRVYREQGLKQSSQGRLVRGERKKKMTVELVEPFVYPSEVKDDAKNPQFNKEEYWTKLKTHFDEAKETTIKFKMEADERHRQVMAEQARAILQGKAEWRPTWREIGSHIKQLTGKDANKLVEREV